MTDEKKERSAEGKLRSELGKRKQDLLHGKEDQARREDEAKKQRIQQEQDAFNMKLREEVNKKEMAVWQDKTKELEASTDAAWEQLEKQATELLETSVNGYDQYHASMSKVFHLQKQLCLALNASEKEWLNSKMPKAKLYAQAAGDFLSARTRGLGSPTKQSAMNAYRKAARYMQGVSEEIEDEKMPFSNAEREALKKVDYAKLITVDTSGKLTIKSVADDPEYQAFLKNAAYKGVDDKRTDAERAEAADGALQAEVALSLAKAGYENVGGCYHRITENVREVLGTGDALERDDLVHVLEGDTDNEFDSFFREHVHASLGGTAPRFGMSF